ncbi:MAG: transposase [Methanoregula sp.]|nr:transposase [Methanoregula sp.]
MFKKEGRAQRKMSRKIRGSHNRRKQRLKVSRIHETVENRRDDLLHKWSNHYVQNYDRISIEKLNIKEMLE